MTNVSDSPPASAEIGAPRYRPVALVVGAWVAWWLLNAAVWYAAYRPNVTVAFALGTFGYWALAWLVATPFILRWMERWASRTHVTAPMAAALVLALVAAPLLQAVLRAIIGPMFYTVPRSFGEDVVHQTLRWADLHAATFAAVALVSRAWVRHQLLRGLRSRVAATTTALAHVQRLFLQRQLRPHFLFNVLSTVLEQAARGRGDPGTPSPAARADQTLAHLETMLTRGMQRETHELVPLAHELEVLEPYLDLQRARFSESMSITLTVDPAALAHRVPLLLLQPLVENAVHHGAARRARDGEVCIHVAATRHGLRIEVLDNGPGLDPVRSEARGLGLRITTARLAHIYGEAASVTVGDRAEGGVRAVVDLPRTAPRRAAPQPTHPPRGEHGGSQRGFAADERSALSGLTRQMQRVWCGWGVLHVTTYTLLAVNLGSELTWSRMVVPVLAIAFWLLVTPPLARLVAFVQWRVRPRHSGVALAVHVGIAAMLGYLAMRLPLTLTGSGDVPVFGPGPLNTIAQNAMLYSLLVVRVELQGIAFRESAHARERRRLEAALAAARTEAEHRTLRPEALLGDVVRLRRILSAAPLEFERELTDFVRRLRVELNRAAAEYVPLEVEIHTVASAGPWPGSCLTVDASAAALCTPVPAGIVRQALEPWIVQDPAEPQGGDGIIIVAARRDSDVPGIDLVLRSERRRPADATSRTLDRAPAIVEYEDAFQVHLFVADHGVVLRAPAMLAGANLSHRS